MKEKQNLKYRAFLLHVALIIFSPFAVRCKLDALDSFPRRKSFLYAFYYVWYDIPSANNNNESSPVSTSTDYKHWNHAVLPHWVSHVNSRYPNIGHNFEPPLYLHSPFYPLRGPYSSRDEQIIRNHFDEMISSGINVAVVSWWGQEGSGYTTDTQGVSTDAIMEVILSVADEYIGSLEVAFHLEPYPSRSAELVREDIVYIIQKYGHHPSLHRLPVPETISESNSMDEKDLSEYRVKSESGVVFFVYDSYHINADQWKRLLSSGGDLSLRKSGKDFAPIFMVGLWLDRGHGVDLATAGFDGAYSYFASDGFSYGATNRNWKSMCAFCKEHGMACIPSVGPGYDDSGIRPWNTHNTKPRRGGRYYEAMWKAAIESKPTFISITSFNEWGEGTQIEPAIAKSVPAGSVAGWDERTYQDYGPSSSADAPFLYLNLTRKYAELFRAGAVAEDAGGDCPVSLTMQQPAYSDSPQQELQQPSDEL